MNIEIMNIEIMNTELFTNLANIFEKIITENMVELYFKLISAELNAGQIESALKYCLKTRKRIEGFPTPGEIISGYKKSLLPEDSKIELAAAKSWRECSLKVCDKMPDNFQDPFTRETIITIWGNWKEFINRDNSNTQEFFNRKEYIKYYKLLRGEYLYGIPAQTDLPFQPEKNKIENTNPLSNNEYLFELAKLKEKLKA